MSIVLRAIGCVALDNDSLGPGWRNKASDHLTKQVNLRLMGGMGFRSDQTKSDWEAIDIPVDDQQSKANPEKPRVMFTFPSFLGQGILRTPLRLLTAVTHEKEGAILGRWQGVQGLLDPPFHQEMDIPVGRLQHATQAPGSHLGRGPVDKLCQGFPPWVQGLHEDQPTQDEAMTTFPDARHPAKQDRDKK